MMATMPSRKKLIEACIILKWGAVDGIRKLPDENRTEAMRGHVRDSEVDRSNLESLDYDHLVKEYLRRDTFQNHLDDEFNKRNAQEKQDKKDIAKAEKFKPQRTKGSISKKTKYIHKLATDKPNEKALALFLAADKNIIGNMSEGTFANHISKARTTKS